MASPQTRLNQRALAVLDVALRVPCIFIIDALLNSSSEPGEGSWAGAAGRLSVRAAGVLVSLVVLLLSQKALFRFYSLFLGVLLAFASVLVNYYAASHSDFHGAYHRSTSSFRLLPKAGSAVWLALAAVQLAFGIGYICLLKVHSLLAALVVLDVVMPLWAMMLELPVDVRQLIAVFSGLALALTTLFCLAVRLRWFYYSCRYVYLLVRHMYRIYGLQLLLEDTWKRIRFPDVLRVFWLTRVTAQALILVYVLQAVRREGHEAAGGATADATAETQAAVLSWDGLGELLSNLIISGCDSTLTVLGMSAVISSVAHYLGLSILAFIGSTEEEDKRLGFVAPRAGLPTVYGLFMADGLSVSLWEKLDDYVYYVRSTGNIIEFLFGVVMFGNGAYTMMFESGSKIRACMMCLHAYFNIYLQAKNGWKTFINRRSAVKKINSLPELKGPRLHNIGDVCAICYQEFSSSARITPCNHYFHALCLRKWLYIQDTCPMCHQRVYIEDDTRDRAAFTNNNGAAVYEQTPREREKQEREEEEEERGRTSSGERRDAGAAAAAEEREINDNDSIEYDSDEWNTQNTAAVPQEEEYMDQDSDSDHN
ncbi:hypothetical protein WMY93_019027 [Mugilogobius chulae]|uniref:E3 ubiquitin-protein ligase RNF139 n=1 Tax=Mugilogobius chulae TaxID=88201 RepID=A0AAW0NQ98_9GOBI